MGLTIFYGELWIYDLGQVAGFGRPNWAFCATSLCYICWLIASVSTRVTSDFAIPPAIRVAGLREALRRLV
jgi:hypothetical protein